MAYIYLLNFWQGLHYITFPSPCLFPKTNDSISFRYVLYFNVFLVVDVDIDPTIKIVLSNPAPLENSTQTFPLYIEAWKRKHRVFIKLSNPGEISKMILVPYGTGKGVTARRSLGTLGLRIEKVGILVQSNYPRMWWMNEITGVAYLLMKHVMQYLHLADEEKSVFSNRWCIFFLWLWCKCRRGRVQFFDGVNVLIY